MFDKHYYIKEDKSVEAARINAKAQAMFSRKLESISEAEIKSKDRVDISLEEYERLKRDLQFFREFSDTLNVLFMKMGIPCDVINGIIPESVKVVSCSCDDYSRFLKRFRIEFSVDETALK